uniref:Uncharacterized protein n=1 Tax=Panagrolaimus davidi TaxID=227884 RepID=A0A914PDQ6_9BILA
MPDIKERITNKLSERINIKNVAEIANKSLKYNSPTLKGYCINFISKCIKDGETYDDAINLNQKIVQELYTTSLCHTVIS